MIGAKLDTYAFGQWSNTLDRRLSDFRKPFEKMGAAARQEFENTFEQSGPGWEPNRAGTETLVKTGDLRASYVRLSAPGNISGVSPAGANFGSSIPYASDHQNGGTITVITKTGKRFQIKLPARPVVKEPPRLLADQFGQIAAAHLTVQAGDRR